MLLSFGLAIVCLTLSCFELIGLAACGRTNLPYRYQMKQFHYSHFLSTYCLVDPVDLFDYRTILELFWEGVSYSFSRNCYFQVVSGSSLDWVPLDCKRQLSCLAQVIDSYLIDPAYSVHEPNVSVTKICLYLGPYDLAITGFEWLDHHPGQPTSVDFNRDYQTFPIFISFVSQ